MERAAILPSVNQNYLLCPSRAFSTRLHSSTRNLSPPSFASIKVNSFLISLSYHLLIYLTHFSDYLSQLQHSSSSVSSNGGISLTRCNAVSSNSSRFVLCFWWVFVQVLRFLLIYMYCLC